MPKIKMTDELLQLAKAIKRLKDPTFVLEEFQKGKSPEDVNLDDDVVKLVRQAGFYNLGHFFDVVLNNSIKELEEYK